MNRLSGSNVSSGCHSVGVAAIACGVVGALLAVAVLLILVMVTVVIIFKYHNNNFNPKEANDQGTV